MQQFLRFLDHDAGVQKAHGMLRLRLHIQTSWEGKPQRRHTPPVVRQIHGCWLAYK